ncbi:MAG: hypothetical protein Q4G04_03385 [bacterium]|nr:hypothetical protein [bacterium]
MKKQIFGCLMVLFCLTGCTVNYNIVIDDKYNVTENIQIFDSTVDEINVDRLLDEYLVFENESYASERDFYVYKNEIEKIVDNGVNIILNRKLGNFSYYNYYDLLLYFDNNTLVEEYDTTYLLYFGKINYDKIMAISTRLGSAEVDINVNIEIPFKVYENNADKVEGNIYTWNINNNNYKDKFIKVVLEKVKIEEENSVIKLKGETSVNILFVILTVIGVLLLVGFVYGYGKSRLKNKL